MTPQKSQKKRMVDMFDEIDKTSTKSASLVRKPNLRNISSLTHPTNLTKTLGIASGAILGTVLTCYLGIQIFTTFFQPKDTNYQQPEQQIYQSTAVDYQSQSQLSIEDSLTPTLEPSPTATTTSTPQPMEILMTIDSITDQYFGIIPRIKEVFSVLPSNTDYTLQYSATDGNWDGIELRMTGECAREIGVGLNCFIGCGSYQYIFRGQPSGPLSFNSNQGGYCSLTFWNYNGVPTQLELTINQGQWNVK